MTDRCLNGGKRWVCTLRAEHEGPCPMWPVRRPRRLMCRVFGHDFNEERNIYVRASDHCRRCGHPANTEW